MPTWCSFNSYQVLPYPTMKNGVQWWCTCPCGTSYFVIFDRPKPTLPHQKCQEQQRDFRTKSHVWSKPVTNYRSDNWYIDAWLQGVVVRSDLLDPDFFFSPETVEECWKHGHPYYEKIFQMTRSCGDGPLAPRVQLWCFIAGYRMRCHLSVVKTFLENKVEITKKRVPKLNNKTQTHMKTYPMKIHYPIILIDHMLQRCWTSAFWGEPLGAALHAQEQFWTADPGGHSRWQRLLSRLKTWLPGSSALDQQQAVSVLLCGRWDVMLKHIETNGQTCWFLYFYTNISLSNVILDSLKTTSKKQIIVVLMMNNRVWVWLFVGKKAWDWNSARATSARCGWWPTRPQHRRGYFGTTMLFYASSC